IFVPAEEFYLRAKAWPRVDLAEGAAGDAEASEDQVVAALLPPLAVDRRAQDPLAALKAFRASSGQRMLVAADSPGRRETMLTYFAEYGLEPAACSDFASFLASSEPFCMAVAPVATGFQLPAENWCVVTEAEL